MVDSTVEFRGASWVPFAELRGAPWSSVERRGAPWSSVELRGAPWSAVELPWWTAVEQFWPTRDFWGLLFLMITIL